MEIRIKIDVDSYNSYPEGYLELRRGINRPGNVVITISDDDDRQIEVPIADMLKALSTL